MIESRLNAEDSSQLFFKCLNWAVTRLIYHNLAFSRNLKISFAIFCVKSYLSLNSNFYKALPNEIHTILIA